MCVCPLPTSFPIPGLCFGLLGDDAIARGREAHVVHLDEGLAVETQPVDQGLEVARQDVDLDQGEDALAQGAEVEVDGVDERGLEAFHAGVLGLDDLEAGVG